MPAMESAITLRDGLVAIAIPASASSPAWEVRSARIGVQWADEEPRFSPEWELVASAPLRAEDELGMYSGLSARFSVAGRLQVEWSAVVYDRLPMAAVALSVSNTSAQDQRLSRLFALHADPRAGATIAMPLDPTKALILNNGPWMPIPEAEWRTSVPEGRFHQGFWSLGLGEPDGPALVAGIGERATSWASVGYARCGASWGMEVGGWLWTDTRERPLRLKPGQTFRLQRMVILPADDLHAGLVAYAEAVQRKMRLHLRFPPYAGIFAAYGSDPAGQYPEKVVLTEERIRSMRQVLDRYLQPYGLDTFKTQFAGLSSGPPGRTMRREEWTNLPIAPFEEGLIERVYESAFTPDVYDSRVDFPHGIEAHVRDLAAHGYRPALVCRPFLNIRSGPPHYDHLAAELFAMAVERWGYEYLMFDFNSHDYESDDDTHTMAEGIRDRFQAVRDRVGPDVFIEACMVSPGPVLGIADGFRQGSDWRGGTEHKLARESSTRYYYHQRWFQLDHEFFDPQLRPFTWQEQGVMGAVASLDRVRMWTSFAALTGFSWLTGGVVENVSPERWWIFQRALPIYGPCARPLDLLQGDPPGKWLLAVRSPVGQHHVLGLFNWSERWQTQWVRPAELGLGGQGRCLCFDFWDQQVLVPDEHLQVELAPGSCRILLIAPESPLPTWVGTDRHVTGAFGLERCSYDEASRTLQGECSGPAHSAQSHYFYLPEGVQPLASEGAAFEVPQCRVLKLSIELDGVGKRAWQVQLANGKIV